MAPVLTTTQCIYPHRDIKPENFLIGRTAKQKENIVHSVDFGLAKPYIDSETKKHIAYAERRSIIGRNDFLIL